MTELICNIDDTIYHSTCLKISNSCAYSLITQGDWCCPECLRQMFPFYEYDILKEQEENSLYYCTCCGKIISLLCHTKLCCSNCDKYMHKECSKANLCDVCYSAAIDDSGSDVNAFIKQESSIHNKDLSTPGQSRVCSNPCYIYYYDDDTIPLQAFLCKFGFWPFFMKFYEKKCLKKNLDKFFQCVQTLVIFLGG